MKKLLTDRQREVLKSVMAFERWLDDNVCRTVDVTRDDIAESLINLMNLAYDAGWNDVMEDVGKDA
jgi:hypothetical protein